MVIQIARTVMPPGAKFHIALQHIFGLGKTNSLAVAEACGISSEVKVRLDCIFAGGCHAINPACFVAVHAVEHVSQTTQRSLASWFGTSRR